MHAKYLKQCRASHVLNSHEFSSAASSPPQVRRWSLGEEEVTCEFEEEETREVVGVWVPLTWRVRKLWDRAAERTENKNKQIWSFLVISWVVCQAQCHATAPPRSPHSFSIGSSARHATTMSMCFHWQGQARRPILLVHDRKTSSKDKEPKTNPRTRICERQDI